MKLSEATLRRRHFLFAVGAGAAATAAALVTRSGPPERVDQATADKRASQGYTETAHVRNYYRTAQV